eukprot:14812606-Heterocapsa_arctica.AAC.1
MDQVLPAGSGQRDPRHLPRHFAVRMENFGKRGVEWNRLGRRVLLRGNLQMHEAFPWKEKAHAPVFAQSQLDSSQERPQGIGRR